MPVRTRPWPRAVSFQVALDFMNSFFVDWSPWKRYSRYVARLERLLTLASAIFAIAAVPATAMVPTRRGGRRVRRRWCTAGSSSSRRRRWSCRSRRRRRWPSSRRRDRGGRRRRSRSGWRCGWRGSSFRRGDAGCRRSARSRSRRCVQAPAPVQAVQFDGHAGGADGVACVAPHAVATYLPTAQLEQVPQTVLAVAVQAAAGTGRRRRSRR